jgi:Arc/MetJ family transcription regulator
VRWLIFPSGAHIRQAYGLTEGRLAVHLYFRRLWVWTARQAALPLRHARGSVSCA